MNDRTLALAVDSPAQVLVVTAQSIARVSVPRYRDQLNGWRGWVAERMAGRLRHLHHLVFDPREHAARFDTDELGRRVLVVGPTVAAIYLEGRPHDTLDKVRRALSDLFERRADAVEALRDLVRSGLVQVEQAPSEV